jgi:Pyruvate/2-oxoacid:ferredoxin oxidoreductase delta subunit
MKYEIFLSIFIKYLKLGGDINIETHDLKFWKIEKERLFWKCIKCNCCIYCPEISIYDILDNKNKPLVKLDNNCYYLTCDEIIIRDII